MIDNTLIFVGRLLLGLYFVVLAATLLLRFRSRAWHTIRI